MSSKSLQYLNFSLEAVRDFIQQFFIHVPTVFPLTCVLLTYFHFCWPALCYFGRMIIISTGC